ncbi:MAG: hypothetical protein SF051_06080 [Elusimicrobiota bacterium]|nr:hypothetical protein [Elusimicrobiota bacterium]
MKKLVLAVLAAAAASSARAASYVEQATFSVTASNIAGLDRDSVGNLYVLQLAPAATFYSVTGYRVPAMEPLFSFETGVRSPLAFAVEPSGVVDVLEGGGTITLRRFLNTGYFLAQSTFSLGPYISTTSLLSAAIDKSRARVLLAYQNQRNYYCVQQVGVDCPPSGLKGYVNEHDMAGSVVGFVEMPGISGTPSSCFTPTKIAVGIAGELAIADANCQQLLRYAPEGNLESQTPASRFGSLVNLRAMWFDADSSLYLSQIVCGAGGCPWGVVKVSPDGSAVTNAAADSAVGSAWDGRMLYLSSSGRSPLRRMIYNEAPTVPAPSAPLGPVVQHSSAAWLRWQASTDADGDPLLYTLEIGTAPFVLRSTGTSETPDFASAPLAFGATYYWRVTARDSYLGLPLQSRASSVENFVLGRANSAPGAFSVSKGTGTLLTRDAFVLLSWTPAADPDGDVPVYEVSWRRHDQAQPAVTTTTANSVTMSGLVFGSTYYWSVRARDPYSAESVMDDGAVQSYAPVLRNTPPTAPVYLSTSAVSTRAVRYDLRWLESEDADEDAVSYRLYLSTQPGVAPMVQEGAATSYPLELSYGTTYYWRVVAVDVVGGTADAGTRTFTATFLNDPPDPLRLNAPFMAAPTIKTMRDGVEVSWERVTNPQGDPISYTAYLGGSPLTLAPVARVEQVGVSALRVTALTAKPQAEAQEDGNAVRLRLTGLDYYRDYYFKVTAENPYGAASQTPLQNFILAAADSFPRAYNYPNPFNSGRGGTSVVFNAPASGYERATLTVYSEFGQKLYERDCGRVPPGISEVRFDGRDRQGRALPSGSYVGRVRFDGPSETATFFLLVVK